MINALYDFQSKQRDAMAQHMSVVRDLARECSSAAEIGIRRGSSTIALLAGTPGNVYSCDIERLHGHARILDASEGRWHPHYGPSEHWDLPVASVDMMVIDGYHTYSQVKMELDRFASKVRKYLVFHDTVSCGLRGDGIANPDIYRSEAMTDTRGIRMAIDELMIADHSWRIMLHLPNDSGLLVLRRDDA